MSEERGARRLSGDGGAVEGSLLFRTFALSGKGCVPSPPRHGSPPRLLLCSALFRACFWRGFVLMVLLGERDLKGHWTEIVKWQEVGVGGDGGGAETTSTPYFTPWPASNCMHF